MATKKFADNPKKDKFIKDCTEIAQSVLGDSYDEDTTVKTAEGIWDDHKDEDYDAKCSIFRNGLKGFSDRSFSITRDNETYYGQLIGTLLQSAVIAHLYHFQTKCRWCHADMEEYYENIVDLLDELCEGILEPLSMDLIYANVIDQKDTPVDYFEELKAFCQDMNEQLFSSQEDSNYASIMDDIINLISKTLYRIKRFDYNNNESEQLAEGNVSFSDRTFSTKKYVVIIYTDKAPELKEYNADEKVTLEGNIESFHVFDDKKMAEDYMDKGEFCNCKRSFSDANGVKPAPQRFAAIFISKDHKLDCNATYKEADQDAVECFVPEGGYGLLEDKGEKFLDDLEANRMVPKCDCEAKIVPAAKVRVRGRIGHSSSSL